MSDELKIIGLTGGICSGKSTVAKILDKHGISIIDADKLGHEAYVPGTPCYYKLIENFGDVIVSDDGKINRPALGAIVFADPSKMKELQDIIWPEIRRMIVEKCTILQQETTRGANKVKAVVLEAAIMIEAGWQDLVSTLWVVTSDKETVLKRLKQRNNLSEEEALKRINSQMKNEERCRYADIVIDNSEGVQEEELEKIVVEHLKALMSQ